ncbi:uncharacterized protein BCR38DRAFT_305751, partial [Pseudomassariella vexata]
THPNIQSVQLIGSWDNFSKCHKMERDSRRDRGQWRGCHTFRDIVCDGDEVGNKRNGGLKMGSTYYYYYEVDGSTETYDPSKPTTNTCPYLPGQTVNTLEVPVEQALRMRSASMNSLRAADFKTMDPSDKFITPRPAPPIPERISPRVGTSPAPAVSFIHKRSARSISPTWTGAARRFLGLKPSTRGGDRTKTPEVDDVEETRSIASSYTREGPRSVSSIRSVANIRLEGTRSTTPSDGVRSRDISPESLRRFLSGGAPVTPPAIEQAPQLSIPEEIVEENEDDDNFATSAVSESVPFTTLSPPPFQRTFSSPSIT